VSEQSPSSRAAPGEPLDGVRGLVAAVVGWALGFVGGSVAVVLVLIVTGTPADDLDELSLGWLAVAQLGLWFGLLGVPLLVSYRMGRGPVQDYGLRLTGRDVPVGAFWGFVTQLLIIPLIYIPLFWLTDISGDDLQEPARGLTERATDPVGVVLLVLIVGIGAPIVEEIFYRGLLQRVLIRLLGTWPGVILTAVLFGVVHFQFLQLPALAVFGLVAGILTLRTGRLGPAIVAHVAFNMITVVLLVGTSGPTVVRAVVGT
jgi:uncharacterized protein